LVRLQKRFAYKYKDKEHYKHVVTIPDETVERLGWKEGEELQQIIEEKTLIVLPTIEAQKKARKARKRQ
jgi:bifunctional DNA-binding transcriptional regulator/antitoxin component of YhaV-PrlF toxin-antitoxin module